MTREGNYILSTQGYVAAHDHGGSKLRKEHSIGGRLAEHVFGYNGARKPHSVPNGYTVHFSRDGRPYLLKLTSSDVNDKDAIEEHKRAELPFNVSREELGNHFGVGIYLYFDFVWFLCWTNFFLLLVSLGNFIPHAYYDRASVLEPYDLDSAWDRASLLSYVSSLNELPWMITNIVALGSFFMFGPIYSVRVKRYLKRHGLDGLDEAMDLEDYIQDNQRFSSSSKAGRMVFSYIVFVVLLAVSSFCAFIIVLASDKLNNLSTTYANTITSVVVAVFIQVMNFIWQQLCQVLNKLERHHTWSSFRTHLTLKYFLFKLLNVLIMYLSRWLVKTEFKSGSSVDNCVLDGVGDQFLFILLLDMTVTNLWHVVSGWVRKKVNERKGMFGEGSNDSARPDFDIADEYLNVLYRQFIIYLGMPIYPLITLLGLICNLLEYRLDKYRLLRICHHPKGMQASMKRFLTFFLFATAFVAVLSFPFGTLWLLSRYSTSNCHQLFSNDAGADDSS